MTDLIGHTIDQYRIVEKIGKGGMGTVYKAEDTETGQTVAVKMMSHRRVYLLHRHGVRGWR